MSARRKVAAFAPPQRFGLSTGALAFFAETSAQNANRSCLFLYSPSAGGVNGNTTVQVAPAAGLPLNSIQPPCCLTICSAM